MDIYICRSALDQLSIETLERACTIIKYSYMSFRVGSAIYRNTREGLYYNQVFSGASILPILSSLLLLILLPISTFLPSQPL